MGTVQITEPRRYSTASYFSRCKIVAARGWHQTQRGSWRKREVAASGKSIVLQMSEGIFKSIVDDHPGSLTLAWFLTGDHLPTPSHCLARGRYIFIKDTTRLHMCDRDSVSGFLNRRKTKEDREGLGEIPGTFKFPGQNALGLVVFSFTSVAPKTLSLSQHVHGSHDSHLPPLR